MSPNPSIERTSYSRLRLLPLAAHVERQATLNAGFLTRQGLLRVARTHAFAVLLIGSVVAVLVFNVFRAAETTVTVGEVPGTLRGVHVVQTNMGTGTLFAVALASGEIVMVSPPLDTPFRENAKVVLVQRRTSSGRDSFIFQAYAPQRESAIAPAKSKLPPTPHVA